MFDLGWPELMLIMVVALIVIGPKELPNAIRTVAGVMRKVRSAAREFQSGLDDIARESGLDDVKRDLTDIEHYDPGEALDAIAESDSDLLNLQDDPEAVNSILDPARKPDSSQKPGEGDPEAVETAAADGDQPSGEGEASAAEEAPAKPAASSGVGT
ncbi:MAG: twin-arginine translocase subunit TatB [Alphaproteobacteria bacterium]|nr:twin-arginine translocase subunit TatB [Alphaproteobacteria bacterium]